MSWRLHLILPSRVIDTCPRVFEASCMARVASNQVAKISMTTERRIEIVGHADSAKSGFKSFLQAAVMLPSTQQSFRCVS